MDDKVYDQREGLYAAGGMSPVGALREYGVGLLGATFAGDRMSATHAQAARDIMIERRILRLEMALRRSGIEVEQLELPR